MTCVVGLAHEGRVYIGADSQATDGRLQSIARKDPKVFQRDGLVFGFTSSYRMGQILRYRLDVPRRYTDESIEEYMHTRFIDAARRALKDGGYCTVSNNVETGGAFLLGIEGRLFHIEADFQIGEPELPFDACGCGDMIALGAMTVLPPSLGPEERIRCAIQAAATHSAGVGGEVTVLHGGEP